MKKYLLFLLLPLIILFNHSIYADSTVLPEFIGGVKPDAVMSKPLTKDETNQCSQATNPDDYQNCILNTMQNHHASAQAIAFNKYSRGWITQYKNYGKLTVIYASIPGADYSDGYFIINDQGEIINVDDYAILSSIDITKNPNYQQIIQRFPSASLWPGNHQSFPDKVTSPENSPRFIFTYSLLNGCHACEIAGTATIGFDFDNDGNFLNAQLIDLTPVPSNTSAPSAAANS